MKFIPEYLREINLISVIVRFLMASILSGVIGLSRGRRQHAAGLRTHLLVCLGAAGVMMINQYMFQYMNWGGDVGRMGAQVVSGIGFLGAGTILVTGKKHIKGLTSAAGLWASACMGLAVGIGFYECAVIMCIFMFIAISTLERFDDAFIKRSKEITIYMEYNSDMPLSRIIKEIRALGWHINGIEQMKTNVENVSSFVVDIEIESNAIDRDMAIENLNKIYGVYFIERI